MRRMLAPAVAATLFLTWSRPAAALDCVAVVELMDAGVSQSVVQDIVLDSPPTDGWSCLDATIHSVAELDMADAFLRLHPTRELAWQVRFKQCDAGLELRRSTRRLWAEDDEQIDEVESESLACRRASALREAITIDQERAFGELGNSVRGPDGTPIPGNEGAPWPGREAMLWA